MRLHLPTADAWPPRAFRHRLAPRGGQCAAAEATAAAPIVGCCRSYEVEQTERPHGPLQTARRRVMCPSALLSLPS